MTTISPLALIKQERASFRDPALVKKLCVWLRDDLTRTRLTRFEQKGRPSVSLASTFVDIDSNADPGAKSGNDIVAELFKRAPSQFGLVPAIEIDRPRADQTSPNNKLGVLLIGGPGQGKSTVTQYLVQRHRAATLEHIRDQLPEKEVALLDEFAAEPAAGPQLPPLRECCLPVRIALPELAAWMSGNSHGAAVAVFEYLRHLIAKATDGDNGQALAPDDLDRLLSLVPWLIVFDGLDEITAASEHEQALSAILAFVKRLRERRARALVVATTRPQTYRDQLVEVFETRHLLPLSKDRALAYAGVLLRLFFEDDRNHQEHVLRELETIYEDHETARLMSSPLQVSIMTELIDEIGQPPRQRWRLFSDYQGIIIARERKRPHAHAVLRQHLAYVEDILRHLGLLLQVMGESGGRAEGLLSGDELELLIAERLVSEGFSEVRRNELAAELRKVAVERLVFLVERRKDAYGFELRPLQEFMAAAALTHGNEQHIEARLTAIANSAAWRNVFLFAASKCFSSDGLYLRDVLVKLCESLNDAAVDPLSADLHGGGAVALAILSDGSVQGPQYEERLARLALGLLQLPANPLHLQLGRVGGKLDALLEEELTERWPEGLNACLGYWAVLAVLCERKLPWAMALGERRWPVTREQQLQVVYLVGRLSYYDNGWLIERIERCVDTLTPQDVVGMCGARTPSLATFTWGDRLHVKVAAVAARGYGEPRSLVRPFGVRAMSFMRSDRRRHILAAETTENPAWRPFQLALQFADSPSKESLAQVLCELADICEPKDLRFWARWLPWPMAGFLAVVDEPAELRAIAAEVRLSRYGDVDDWRAQEQAWAKGVVAVEDLLATFAQWPHLALLVDPYHLFDVCKTRDEGVLGALIGDPGLASSRAGTRLQQQLGWLNYLSELQIGETRGLLSPAELVQRYGRALIEGPLGVFELQSYLGSHPPQEAADLLIRLSALINYSAWVHSTWIPMPGQYDDELLRSDCQAIVDHPDSRGARRVLATRLIHAPPNFAFAADALPPPSSEDEDARVDHLVLQINGASDVEEAAVHTKSLLELPQAAKLLPDILIPTLRRLLGKDLFASPAAQSRMYRALRPWAKVDLVIELFQSRLAARPTGLSDSALWYDVGLGAPVPAILGTKIIGSDPTAAAARARSTEAGFGLLGQVTVANLRVFEHIELTIPKPTHEGQWLILVGENGVGKSTVLRALVLALAPTEVAQQLVANSRSPLLRSVRHEGRVTVEIGGIKHSRTIATERQAEKLHDKTPNGPERPPLFAYGCARGSAAAGEDAPPDYTPVNDVLTLFDDRARLTPAKSWLTSLFAHARSHGGEHAELYKTVTATLVHLLDGIEEIEVDGDGPWFTGPKIGARVPLASLSDGYITTVGWVVDLLARWVHWTKQRGLALEANFNETMQAIVLVDEIDLHLHPRWQLDVITSFRELFPRVTFVVTTHNPLTLLSARPGEIFVLQHDEQGVVQARQRDLPPGIRADQVLTGEWFGLVSTRDPETLSLLEEHNRHLREHRAPDDPQRVKVEDELRRRLEQFPGTTIEQLMRAAIAKGFAQDAPPLEPHRREQVKHKFDMLMSKYLKPEG